MIVKDEANRIGGALDGVVDLFDEVRIVDTGSTDGTPDILRERYGIEALYMPLREADCYCLARVRNANAERFDSPWILTLDGDERVSRADLSAVIAMAEPEDRNVAGFFCAWNTYRGADMVADYKLALVRREMRRFGLAHDNCQYDVRRRGLRGAWLDTLRLRHLPETEKDVGKASFYRWQLETALVRDPAWACRYHWFLGYMLWRAGNVTEGEPHLVRAARADDPLFPVERLNAATVLADIHARRGDGAAAVAILEQARADLAAVAGDFEVRVNFRLGPWLDAALAAARAGDLAAVRAYGFSC